MTTSCSVVEGCSKPCASICWCLAYVLRRVRVDNGEFFESPVRDPIELIRVAHVIQKANYGRFWGSAVFTLKEINLCSLVVAQVLSKRTGVVVILVEAS